MSNKIGIVFAGGGGKGAYQIGVWKALRETGLDKEVKAVAGTSVGGLNAVMFALGNFSQARRIWESLTRDQVLKLNAAPNCVFSNKNLEKLIRHNVDLHSFDGNQKIPCWLTVTLEGAAKYQNISDMGMTANERVQWLLATAALPYIFPTQTIDNEKYIDGGIADNVPITPLYEMENCNIIIVIHLNQSPTRHDQSIKKSNYQNATIIQIWPQKCQGNMLTGTLDFNSKHSKRRMDEGYIENINYFKFLSNHLNDNELPDFKTIEFENTLSQYENNIESLTSAESELDEIEKQTLEYEREIIKSYQYKFESLLNTQRIIAASAEIDHYLNICSFLKAPNGTLYTDLPLAERILKAVSDVFDLCKDDYYIDDTSIDVIIARLNIPIKIEISEFVRSARSTPKSVINFTGTNYISDIDISEYLKAIWCSDMFCSNDTADASEIFSALLEDLQKIQNYLTEKGKKENVCKAKDKSIFSKGVTEASIELSELYKDYCNDTLKKHSDTISKECADFIKRWCDNFKRNNYINNNESFLKKIGKKYSSDIFLYHDDTVKSHERGFAITKSGIYSSLEIHSKVTNIYSSFSEFADFTEFKKHYSKNVIKKLKKRRRIEGYVPGNQTLKPIIPYQHFDGGSTIVIPFLETIRNACWVDLHL